MECHIFSRISKVETVTCCSVYSNSGIARGARKSSCESCERFGKSSTILLQNKLQNSSTGSSVGLNDLTLTIILDSLNSTDCTRLTITLLPGLKSELK